jgi:hypothetical protein
MAEASPRQEKRVIPEEIAAANRKKSAKNEKTGYFDCPVSSFILIGKPSI